MADARQELINSELNKLMKQHGEALKLIVQELEALKKRVTRLETR